MTTTVALSHCPACASELKQAIDTFCPNVACTYDGGFVRIDGWLVKLVEKSDYRPEDIRAAYAVIEAHTRGRLTPFQRDRFAQEIVEKLVGKRHVYWVQERIPDPAPISIAA